MKSRDPGRPEPSDGPTHQAIASATRPGSVISITWPARNPM